VSRLWRDDVDHPMLVRVAHHPTHAGQSRQFLRRALRVAAGHQDAALGILAMNAPDGGAHVPVRRFGHRAGVQHHHAGVVSGIGALQPPLEHLALQRGAIRLRGPAPEVLQIESPHALIIGRGFRNQL
jgi:hypothetical protein